MWSQIIAAMMDFVYTETYICDSIRDCSTNLMLQLVIFISSERKHEHGGLF